LSRDDPNFARREEVLLKLMEGLDERLARVENSLLFRSNRSVGRLLDTYKKKLGQRLLKSGWHSFYVRLAPPTDERYALWVQRQEESAPEVRQLAYRPTISVVMPVHKPKRDWLEAAIASVRQQTYSNWQLCICDDATREPWLVEFLTGLAGADSRIRFVISDTPLGIAGASNRAGELADGEYVAFLDHDDVLDRYALHYIAEACQESGVQIVYSDEDCLNAESRRALPRFKPDWSPDLLTCCMYLGHLFVVDRRLLDEVSWFREGVDGAQDYDLALRLTDRARTIRHVPRVLYHWRQHEGSTAGNPQAKQYAHPVARKALEDTLQRRQIEGTIEDGTAPGTFHIQRRVHGSPLVSVVVCSRNPRMVERMLAKLDAATDYPNFEVVLVEHGCVFDLPRKLIRVPFTGAFNFAAMNNLGAKSANGSMLLFLNDDVEPLHADWMGRLVAHLQRPEVGAVGAKLLYPSGAIQHAGIALGMMDGVGHPGRGVFRSDLFPWVDTTRNVSAVTGACLGMRREVFEETGGFDEAFPVNYNDVDLCLRLREQGYEVIYDATVRLVHKESASRAGGTRLRERVNFYTRWFSKLESPDPYLPRALDRDDEGIRLALE
jgi:GT2 family glycosyltransferase